ncbi:MAG: DUF2520 domain-containing protein [Flavobacteriaceae bacterium]|nr:DUF2520 domain-containing protein [Flavobacteriaceae bacterium]
MIKITLIGAGNVAQHLYRAIQQSPSCEMVQWYARNLDRIYKYQEEVKLCDQIKSLETADVYILAISDDAIVPFAQVLPPLGGLLVHTSGTVGMHQLPKQFRRGVLYPIQTFSSDVAMPFDQVPFCLEAEQKSDMQLLKSIASSFGCPTYKMSSSSRAHIHLAAVFVNNFTNQLYRIGHEITESQGIHFDILKPLIRETANKVQEQSPYRSQTGPAKRGDKKTIKKHHKLLHEREDFMKIYQQLTNSIAKTHGKKL